MCDHFQPHVLLRQHFLLLWFIKFGAKRKQFKQQTNQKCPFHSDSDVGTRPSVKALKCNGWIQEL